MPKVKNNEKENNPLYEALRKIEIDNPDLVGQEDDSKIVDIITFCYDEKYLDIRGNGLEEGLFPGQSVILKAFYKGTIGNETLELTQEEWEWLYDRKDDVTIDEVVYERNMRDVIKKLHEKEKEEAYNPFTQLVLVLGRRGSKTFMASIITAYEAYKLILINGGDPHRYYNLPDDDEIAIINVALSQKQAGRLFGQVQARIRNSPFFKGRIAKETSDSVRLYTDRDLEKKANGSILSVPGSILLLCGHSNPDSLAGYNAILLLFDEIAFYDESGKVTGKYFVNRLKPSLSKFYKYKAGKVVMISSPNARSGVFYEAFEDAVSSNPGINSTSLSFQLPTWDINLDVTYADTELIKVRESNPDLFHVEYGAQWSVGGAYGNYFEEDAVNRCLRLEGGPHKRPQPRVNYYIHVDPAKKSNNYAAVMVAKENYVTPQGHKRSRCRLAGVWVWKPTPGLGLLFENIDKEIINICSIFHPMSVTYDDYHSVHSVQRLRSHGINCTQIPFNDRVKCKVYQNLRNMMLFQPEPEILLYDDSAETALLIDELKSLKFKKTKRGYSILPDKGANVNTDDLCVSKDTIVFTNTPKRISEVSVGEKILTASGSYRTVTDCSVHNTANDIIKIKPYYGLPLEATSNHPVECWTDQKTWARADEIDLSSKVIRSFDITEKNFSIDLRQYINDDVGPRHRAIANCIGDKLRDNNANAKWHNRYIYSDDSFAYISGIFIAEGSIANHGIAISGHCEELDIQQKTVQCCYNVFNFEPSGYRKQVDSKGCQATLNSVLVKKLFIDFFGHNKAHDKVLPKRIMQAPLDFQKSFLKGYWDGDGFNDKKRIGFTTTSVGLALQIQMILLRLGCISSIQRIDRKGKKSTFRGRSYFQQDLYNIYVTDADSYNKLGGILGVRYKKKHSKFHKKHYNFLKSSVVLDVYSVENIGKPEELVCNLTVEGEHSYVSGCVNSHNCDCLAGAVSAASEGLRPSLPTPTVVRTGWV